MARKKSLVLSSLLTAIIAITLVDVSHAQSPAPATPMPLQMPALAGPANPQVQAKPQPPALLPAPSAAANSQASVSAKPLPKAEKTTATGAATPTQPQWRSANVPASVKSPALASPSSPVAQAAVEKPAGGAGTSPTTAVAEPAKPVPTETTPKATPSVPESDPAALALVTEAFGKTQSAKSIEDFTAIIDLCGRGLAGGLNKSAASYAQKLTSWAYNRRGELNVRQADAAAIAGKQDEAQQFDKKAFRDFDASVNLDRTCWRAWHNRGVSRAQFGLFKEALADFDETTRLQPQYANVWFNRGEVLYALGQYEKSITSYSESLKLSPGDVETIRGRGCAYNRLERHVDAVADFERASKLEPTNAENFLRLADASAAMGNWLNAARGYKTAIDLDQTSPRAYCGAAWLMATCPDARYRNAQMAVTAARRAVELGGEKDYRSLDALAAALADQGLFKEARDTLDKAMKVAPPAEAQRLHNRLVLYQEERPYRTPIRTAVMPAGDIQRR